MRLSPLDIRKQEFSRGLRGYDVDEVQAFLKVVSEQMDEMQGAERRLQQQVQDLASKLQHYEKVEEALQEALQTSRESARQALENARHQAQGILKNAEADAKGIRRDAEQDVLRLRREAEQLTRRRDEIVARLRAFLMSEVELLARFEGAAPGSLSELMPKVERPQAGPPPAGTASAGSSPAAPPAVPDREEDAGAEPAAEAETPAPPRPAEQIPSRKEPTLYEGAPRHEAAPRDTPPEPEAPTAASPEEEAAPVPAARPVDVAPPPSGREAQERKPPVPLPVPEQGRAGSGWRVRPLVSAATQSTREEDASAEAAPAEGEVKVTPSSEEIERIRRILRDLD